MPTSTAWRQLPKSNQEILEIVASDATQDTTCEREHLIQMAATVMAAGTQPDGCVEIPLSVEVTQEGDLALKMTLSYMAQPAPGMAARMAARRRQILRACVS